MESRSLNLDSIDTIHVSLPQRRTEQSYVESWYKEQDSRILSPRSRTAGPDVGLGIPAQKININCKILPGKVRGLSELRNAKPDQIALILEQKPKLIISFLDHQPLLILTTLILVASARQAPYLACLRVLRLAIRPRSQFQDSSLFYTRLSCTSYYENLPSKNFFSYKSLNARKGKIKYRRATYKIRRRVFFVLRVAQVKKAKDFFFQRATYKGTYVEAVESARAGLLPKIGGREKKRRRPRKVVCRHKKGM